MDLGGNAFADVLDRQKPRVRRAVVRFYRMQDREPGFPCPELGRSREGVDRVMYGG